MMKMMIVLWVASAFKLSVHRGQHWQTDLRRECTFTQCGDSADDDDDDDGDGDDDNDDNDD